MKEKLENMNEKINVNQRETAETYMKEKCDKIEM